MDEPQTPYGRPTCTPRTTLMRPSHGKDTHPNIDTPRIPAGHHTDARRVPREQRMGNPRAPRGQNVGTPRTAFGQPTNGPRTPHEHPMSTPRARYRQQADARRASHGGLTYETCDWRATHPQPLDLGTLRTAHGQHPGVLRAPRGHPTNAPWAPHGQSADSPWTPRRRSMDPHRLCEDPMGAPQGQPMDNP